MSNNNSFSGIRLNQPNLKLFKKRQKEHKKRVNSISKELQGVHKISEKTLNKRFTI